jgi:ATP-dependent Zn protease
VTIIRHGSALGFAAYKPKEEAYTRTREEYLGNIQVSLASRAAEQLFLGIELSGAHHDLQSATAIADAVIRHFGMNGSLYQAPALGEYLPDAKSKKEIERLLEQQFKKVKMMLESHREEVHAIAAQLVERLELTGDEVFEIIAEVEQKRAQSNNGTNGTVHAATPVTPVASEGM